MEDRSVHQRRFEAAVKVMRTLPADGVFVPSEDMLIRFKTYHRQATVGVCKSSEACGRDTLSKAEWEAWKALGDMSKEEAMKAYVEEILLILEMIPVTEEVSNLLDVLEPFYEVVEDEDKEEGDVNVLRFTSQFCLFCETGSSDEYRGSSAGDVDDDVEEDDDDDAEDVTRLTGANRTERGGTPVCNGRVSSLTVSPHSSLNTDEEEEEPEHTPAMRQEMRRDSPAHVPQLLADDCFTDGGDVSEQSCDESVSEVCSDSVRAEEGSGGLRAAAAPAKRPQGRGGNTKEEGVSQDGNPQGAALPPLHTAAHGPLRSVILSAGRGRGEGFRHLSGCKVSGESATCLSDVATVLNGGKAGQGMVTGQLNTQIVVALSRLQDDMRSVLASLSTLETRALSQVERLALRSAPHTPQHLRKCPWTVSPISVAFLLLWPFVAHYLAWLYLQKKRFVKHISIHPFIIYTRFIPNYGHGDLLEPIPAHTG
ncbi:acyl-CoA-binding domain-containing protein 5-B [Hemibagrus wyckioides]|uniref:acyl-CoA-binding domain-containing protein 5-B n=1 Tax=Hemibagrus wyckioides TaxID=337641 RepID=UPI00266DD36F|nr:acyl-CoA-binding domain-containing protein 5-B [Hemibagrus wyckioides]